jgi:hypothetical protein
VVDHDAPDHFVLDLHEIAGVEERGVVEERVGDALPPRIEGAALPQGSDFRVRALAVRHEDSSGIYAARGRRS